MKNVVKSMVVVMLLMVSGFTFADVSKSVFGEYTKMDQEDNAGNVGGLIGVDLYKNFGIEGFAVSNKDGPVLGLSGSLKFGNIHVGYGIHETELNKSVNVAGVNVNGYDRSIGNHVFAQYDIGKVFVRYTYATNDYDLNASRITNPIVNGSPCQKTNSCKVASSYEHVETGDHWLWIGYNF